MAYGLEIYNSSGQDRMTITAETSKIAGHFTGSASSDPYYVTLTGEGNADGASSPLRYGILLKHNLPFAIPGDNTRSIVIGTGANKGKAVLTGYNGSSYDFYLVRIEGD